MCAYIKKTRLNTKVTTLFHETGHGLQHMLTTVKHAPAAGISGVEWDAVELPSQFMENWCFDEGTVKKSFYLKYLNVYICGYVLLLLLLLLFFCQLYYTYTPD
jgi:oligoendopeptidase F